MRIFFSILSVVKRYTRADPCIRANPALAPSFDRQIMQIQPLWLCQSFGPLFLLTNLETRSHLFTNPVSDPG